MDRLKRFKRRHRYFGSEDGYTLMELLVVLAILGFLAAIATPAVIRYLDSAKVSTAKTEIANISAALDLYKLDVGHYPATADGLKALMTAPQSAQNWNGPYLKKTTGLNDPWGHPYHYVSPGQHGAFDLYSFGEKGNGTNDTAKPQIANW